MARKIFARNIPAGTRFRSLARLTTVTALAMLISACGNVDVVASDAPVGPRPGPARKANPAYDDSIFGDDGLAVSTLDSRNAGSILGGSDEKARLPVNKYLWQGALDTLSFLPLVSSDPFSGVIATDWGSTPNAPGERFKVTAYILNPGLTAAALKVAVYREVRSEEGLWSPAQVSGDTARKLEDAILTRARQIRIAGLDGGTTG